MRTLLVCNPGSRGGSSAKRLARIERLAAGLGLSAEMEVTRRLEDARELCVRGQEEGFSRIVAVGGDGTINQVLQGMYREDGTRRSAAAMGVVYTGTSPDFCASYGIPLEHEAAMRLVARGTARKVTVGRLVMPGDGGRDRAVFFGCCANIGLGASVARRANRGIRRRLGDTLGTFSSLIAAIAAFFPVTVLAEIDGEMHLLEETWNVSVGRTRFIASGIKVAHDLKPTDDRFYLMIVQKMRLARWPYVLRRAYGGAPFAQTEFFRLEYGRRISLSSKDAMVEVEMDGDPAGVLPCFIEAAREPLDLLSEGDSC